MNFSRFIAVRLTSSGQKSFTRTIVRIATAAVAISICVMLVTVALIHGFKHEISEKVYGFWGHINITDIRADNSYEALPIVKDSLLITRLENIAEVEVDYGQNGKWPIRSNAGVAHVQCVAHIPAIVTNDGEMEGVVVKGVGQDFDWTVMERFIVEGGLPDLESDEKVADLLVSEYTALRLDLSAGDKIIVHFLKNDRQVQRRFTIRGLYRTGLEDYDKKFALAPIAIVQDLLGWEENQVGAYEVFIEDIDDADVINDYIYLEELPSKLYAQTIRSRFPNIFEWLELQDVNQMFILGLTLIVAIINMVSVLLILILERTRMIGIFKALGSTSWKIQEIFLYHAVLIILKGMIIGNVLGIGLCLLQKHFKLITLNEEDYYLSYAPVDLSLGPILTINVVSILVIMICLLIPSLLISRVDPVKTIQFR